MIRTLAICLLLAAPATAQTPIPVPFEGHAEGARISVTVTPGLRSMAAIPEPRLRVLRDRMHRGVYVPDAGLRELADKGDGLAAQRYVRRLIDRNDPDRHASDIAHYAAVAVGTGRVWTLPDMIAAMERLDPAQEPAWRVRKLISVLYPHAWAGNTLALDAVQRFNGEGRLFGPLSEGTRQRILQTAEAAEGTRLQMRLALDILARADRTGALPAEDRETLLALLERIADGAHPGARASAETLQRLTLARYGP